MVATSVALCVKYTIYYRTMRFNTSKCSWGCEQRQNAAPISTFKLFFPHSNFGTDLFTLCNAWSQIRLFVNVRKSVWLVIIYSYPCIPIYACYIPPLPWIGKFIKQSKCNHTHKKRLFFYFFLSLHQIPDIFGYLWTNSEKFAFSYTKYKIKTIIFIVLINLWVRLMLQCDLW